MNIRKLLKRGKMVKVIRDITVHCVAGNVIKVIEHTVLVGKEQKRVLNVSIAINGYVIYVIKGGTARSILNPHIV